ncbi:uncharacterized protein LOC127281456 [Leptopilina boulardi]|uniref:uncharacterized protein LOC127281456 n=1 Tax=Leptopilina boulardi TaxID=63433 RepID=UPI0021F63168|nr:uncharacterized protein LOC127281456 [Leptopilina boulardi]
MKRGNVSLKDGKRDGMGIQKEGGHTHRLIPHLATWLDREHGEVGYYLTQALSGHGCFGHYLHRFKIRKASKCVYCDAQIDDAEHTLFSYEHWSENREAVFTAVETRFNPDTMVSIMLQSVESWRHIETFVINVMLTKVKDGRPGLTGRCLSARQGSSRRGRRRI